MPASTPPSQRKRPPQGANRPSDGTDVLQVLVFSKLLTPDQVEPIRRTAKTKSTSVEEAIVDLGLLTDVQIADALARYAGLRFVKIRSEERRVGKGRRG